MNEELMAMIESLVQEHYGTQGLDYLRQRTNPAPAVQVPEGYVPVPVEPTQEMLLKSGLYDDDTIHVDSARSFAGQIYRAMLAAAPAPAPVATEAVAQGGGVDVEKVMALVEEHARHRVSAQYHSIRNDREYWRAETKLADEAKAQIRALLASAPAVPGFRIVTDDTLPPRTMKVGDVTVTGLSDAPAVPAGDGWMPIETAPKDGGVFLVFCPFEEPEVVAAKWHSNEHWSGIVYAEELLQDVVASGPAPTHWQPLPPTPAAKKKEKGE